MIPIHPIDKETCRPFIGHLVCAVTHDGNRHIGILSRINNGRLFLNDLGQEVRRANKTRVKGKKAAAKSKDQRNSDSALAGFAEGPNGFSGVGPLSIPPTPISSDPSTFLSPVTLRVAEISLLFPVVL